MKHFLSFSLMLLSVSAFAERFNPDNNPSLFSKVVGGSIVTNFDSLPLSGKLSDDRLGWSETYWPSNKVGIAYRWNSPDPQPFKYRFFTKEELKRMSEKEMLELSPSELYDIAMSDYNYTLTRKVLSLYTPKDLWWEGICHGWSPAAANYPEPAPVVIVNKDGIKVPFGSSDVKGLLAMHSAYNYKGTYAQVGKRCGVSGKVQGEGDDRDANPNPPTPELANTPDCKDMNAGAFHVVLTNMIGIYSKSFVADVDRFNDVWNQPVTSYSSAIASEEAVSSEETASGIARKVRMQTKFTYGEELKFYTPELAAQGAQNFVSKFPVTGTVHQEFRSKNYEYILELDANGNVTGGEWVSETRPDFVWMITRDRTFNNSPYPLKGLNFIYRPLER